MIRSARKRRSSPVSRQSWQRSRRLSDTSRVLNDASPSTPDVSGEWPCSRSSIWTEPCWTAIPRRFGSGSECAVRRSGPGATLGSCPDRWPHGRPAPHPPRRRLDLAVDRHGWAQRASLRESCARFGRAFRAGASALAWRVGGMAALKSNSGRRSRRRGHRRARHPGPGPDRPAGPSDRGARHLAEAPRGGWVADIHCRNQRKCQALAEAGTARAGPTPIPTASTTCRCCAARKRR
jgi:hypothetical protein